jgi:hypothetical protein
MTPKHIALTIAVVLFTALNVLSWAVNWSIRAQAGVAGMDYSDLRRDSDFRRAVESIVKSIVESCRVDGDRIRC